MKGTKRKICFSVAFLLFLVCVMTGCDRYDEKEEIQGLLGDVKSEAEKLVEGVFSGYESLDGYDINEATIFESGIAIESGSVERTIENMTASTLCAQIGGVTLEILVSGDGSFRLATENVGKFQIYQKDDQFYIKAVGSSKVNETDSKIYMYLPGKDGFKNMDLEVGAGQIKVSGLQVDDATVSVGAGNVILTDMEMQNLDVGVDMGNFATSATITGGAKAECAMGNLQLMLKGSEASYDYKLTCMAGSIKIGSDQYGGSVIKEKQINNGTGRLLDLNCSMGNIALTFE